MARWAATDEQRKADATERLRLAAIGIASRDSIDPVELHELDGLLQTAGKSRSQFAADVGRLAAIAELRRQIAVIDEAALRRAADDAKRDLDSVRAAGEGITPWNGSAADQRRWDEASVAQVRRQNEAQAKIRLAGEELANLQGRRKQLQELESAAGRL